jgi:hypothetical protein
LTERTYCSDLARAAKEPLIGTASHARGCVLVSYPKRMWARSTLDSEGLPRSLLDAIDRLGREHDVVTRLVAHEGTWNERVELSLYPQARRHRDVPLADAGALLTHAKPADGEPITSPMIAVCTHGVRDRCCALYGGALVDALRETGGDVDVREASHLGGDRFAPVVLVLPSGHMYGHLTPSDGPALVLAARDGPVLRERFRGSLWRDPLEQLAEVAAVDAFDGLVPALGPVTRIEHGEERATLRCVATRGDTTTSLEVQCAREHRLVVGDCRNADIGRRGSVRIWRIEHVRVTREPR